MFNVILYNPQIPPNTGNIIRLSANTGINLHLIRPLGFHINEKSYRRAALDYGEMANLIIHDDFMNDLLKFQDFQISSKNSIFFNILKNMITDSQIFLALMVALTANTDFISSLAVSASTIGNIGPGLGAISPINNWADFPDSTKWITSFGMLLGRLEIFTVIILFSKTYWKR